MYLFDNKYNVFIQNNIIEIGNFLQVSFRNVPDSGWKIHISCIEKNYNEILNTVSEYCISNKITFKVVKDINLYLSNGRKNGDRTSYGKFITVYPENEMMFVKYIEELYLLLKGYEGPYILTDKRYKDCKCLYYRYGSNKLQNIYDNEGTAIRIIKYNNIEYQDIPVGYYNTPDFIQEPFELSTDEDLSNQLMIKYDVKEGLSFSPIGGVYKAQSKNSPQLWCIVKEFYPHTSIINSNVDSFVLFENEVNNLKELQKFSFVPRFIESFKDWENYYLIEEFIEGDTLEEYVAENNKIVLGSDIKTTKDYILRILKIFLKLIDNMVSLYQCNYMLTDISPDNIIINKGEVYFVDLESVRKINEENKIISYTLNFYDINKSAEQNIKLSICNLLLYCFNKKSSLFNVFSPEQILEPIVRRYPLVNEILEVINHINEPNVKISDIKEIFKNTWEKVEEIDKLEVTDNSFIRVEDYKVSQDMISCDGFVFDALKNKNSLAFGTLGQFLACNYIFDKKYKLADFENYISDYRTTSFFWGHSGLLYLLDLNNIDSQEVLSKILKNINYEDISLKTGIAGIGISLLYHYSMKKDKAIIEIIENIRECLRKVPIDKFDNSLENGKLGIALFYIYDYYVFGKEISLKKSIEYLDNVILELDSNRYKKTLKKGLNFEFYEYYIANGICGLIMVLIEFTTKTGNDIYIDKIKYFVKMCFGIYSISPSYFTGNAGFLYTFFKVSKNIKLSPYMKKQVLNQIEHFYLDIMNTITEGTIYDSNFKNHEKHFLGGKEGVLTIIDVVNKDADDKKIFPFIL